MNSKIESRRDQVLAILKKFDYLTVKQVSAICGWTEHNSHRILNQLSSYLSVFKYNSMNVYYLNKRGRTFIGSTKVRTRLVSFLHYLMRNNLYIHLGQPESWKNEIRIRYVYDKTDPHSEKIVIVSDALYKKDNRFYLIEIDNDQTMKENRSKVERYRRLIEKGVFGGMPELIWVTTTLYRRRELMNLCDGLKTSVYLSDLRGQLS